MVGKLCKKCNTLNENNSVFCYKCGFRLDLLDNWREYHLISSDSPKLINNLYFKIYNKRGLPSINSRMKRWEILLKMDIDFLQTYDIDHPYRARNVLNVFDLDKYRFYVKDNKFGLIDFMTFDIQIRAIYDELTWYKKGSVLKAVLNGESIFIDINGKQINKRK